jgi:predicted TIM-barrel fold metal-dependent hydrolase
LPPSPKNGRRIGKANDISQDHGAEMTQEPAATAVQTRSMAALKTWHDRYTEAAIAPELPIIDAHHHMWDRPPEHYGLPELLEEFAQGHNIRASVFVECTAMFKADGPESLRPVGETEYVNGVAAMSASGIYGDTRLCAGIVSYADLRWGAEVRPLLQAHIRAGGGRFRGIRQQAQFDDVLGSMARRKPPRGLLLDPVFRAGFAELGALDLSFDAYIYFSQLDELRDLAKSFPGTTVILNHAGTPLGLGPYAEEREKVFKTWSEGIKRLAECPNVTLKFGGLGMAACGFDFHLREIPPDSDTLAQAWKPYFDVCIDAFGAARCMFESNFPVDKQSCSYPVLWNAFKKLSAGCSSEAQTQLFSGTAGRVYRIVV